MRVADIMSKPLCIVDPEATLAEATTLMAENRVGSAIVCSGDRLLGIVTERDVVRAMSGSHDAAIRPVDEWMTRRPVTIGPETEVRDALRTMVDGGFRHLPVLEDDKIVGMVSMRDIATAMAD
jgi:CBS domain-containing protein